ncbi:MAG: hypothetical protein JST39_05470 [Bacteroidetes bacterium]|nr:hypothetical protein [Bacteroidota bacterium]
MKNAWGFCNEGRVYIRMGDNFFPLFKCGATWDLYGTTNMRMHISQGGLAIVQGNALASLFATALSAALASSMSDKEPRLTSLEPLQLDIETGKVY